jgi:hypothetical protein
MINNKIIIEKNLMKKNNKINMKKKTTIVNKIVKIKKNIKISNDFYLDKIIIIRIKKNIIDFN